MEKTVKKTKEQLIKEHIQKPYVVGEIVKVRGLGIQGKSWGHCTEIKEIRDGGVLIEKYGSFKFVPFDDIKKETVFIGHDPFPKRRDKLQIINFSLDTHIHRLTKEDTYKIGGNEVIGINFNPFVYDKNGNKVYYQRGKVWDIKTKRKLIASIINRVSCGLIVVRERSWKSLQEMAKKGETELSFMDVVDGKQRLLTVYDFVTNKFKYDGYYYKDWSVVAQREFGNSQSLSYGQLPESTTDEETIKQFLKTNIAGVPQNEEHIEFVKSIDI